MRRVLTPIKAKGKKRMNNRKQNWFGLKQTKPPTKTAFDECIMNRADKHIHTQHATICEREKKKKTASRLLHITHLAHSHKHSYIHQRHRQNTHTHAIPYNLQTSPFSKTLLIDNIH